MGRPGIVEGVVANTAASYGLDAMRLTRTSLAAKSASITNQRFGVQVFDGFRITEYLDSLVGHNIAITRVLLVR